MRFYAVLFYSFLSHSLLAGELDRIVFASTQINDVVSSLTESKNRCGEKNTIPFKPEEGETLNLYYNHAVTSQEEYQKLLGSVPEIKPSKESPFYVSFIFENDKRFGYEQLSGKKSDDAGRTHAVELHLGKVFDNGISRELELSTKLYTSRVKNLLDENGHLVRFSKEGERLTYSHMQNGVPVYKDQNGVVVPEAGMTKKPQFFNEVNSVTFVQDNIKKGDLLYYKAGVGMVMVVSDQETAWGAAIQQKKWHELRGKTVYTNVSDGEKDRYGVTILGAVGLQKEMEARSIDVGIGTIHYRLKGTLELSGEHDTLGNKSYFAKVMGGVGFGKEVRSGERRFESSVSIAHGSSTIEKFEMALNMKDCSVFINYNKYINDEKKYAPKDEGTMKLGAKCYFY